MITVESVRQWRWRSSAMVALVFATTVLAVFWRSSKEPQIAVSEGKGEKQLQILENGSVGSSNNNDSNNNNNTLDMLRVQFQAAREQYINQLQIDYGADTVENMFMREIELENGQKQQSSVGRTIYQSPSGPDGPSWDRLVRKVTKKILQSHLLLQSDASSKASNKHTTTFVWATGGHSAAAGHGNYFNESYTAVLGRNAKHMFAAVGLDFYARNMAMGGTPSGHEIASCTKEVFGSDMDVLSWDYGMLDGKGAHNFELYFHRASLSPSRPACIGLRFGARSDRINVFRDMEQRGLTTLWVPGTKAILDAVPDSADLTLDEVKEMPSYVQSFKCNGKLENGEPTCAGAKYNLNGGECDDRPYKASWHPGWKIHAVDGNLMTLFLMEIIDDAIKHIETHGSDPALLLRQLQEQEDAEYQIFLTSGPPLLGHRLFQDDATIPTDVSIETIYKGPNICHTARLPSQIRYLGILTDNYNPNDNDKTLVPYNYDIHSIEAGQGPYNYDTGVTAPNASSAPNPDGEMRLVYDPKERHRCAPRVHNDYRDWFMAHGHYQQSSKLVLPNAAEKAVYLTQQKEPLKGIIALCFCACTWGKCPEHSVNRQQFVYENAASIQVNGIPVANLTFFGACNLLRDTNGGHIWKANANGQFEISTKVHNEIDFMRVSSFIIW